MGGNAYASMQHRFADKLSYIQSPIRRNPARMDCGVFWFRQNLSIFAVNLPEKFHTVALARLFFVRARFFVPFFNQKET